MENQILYVETVEILSGLMRDTFGDKFVSYYEGDPQTIPQNNLPCIIVEKVNSQVTTVGAPTGHDVHNEEITIRLVLDKADDVGASDDLDLTERKLRRLVEGLDKDTRSFAAGTAMYALRTNITLGNKKLSNQIDINYDIQGRPDMEITSEALISVVVSENIPMPLRI